MLLLHHGPKRGLLTVKRMEGSSHTDKPTPPVSEDAWRKCLANGHALGGSSMTAPSSLKQLAKSHLHCLSRLYPLYSLKTSVVV